MNEPSELRGKVEEIVKFITLSEYPSPKGVSMILALIEPVLEERESLKLQVESTMEHHVAETKDLYKRIADLESFARECVEALERFTSFGPKYRPEIKQGWVMKFAAQRLRTTRLLSKDLAKKLRGEK